MSTFPKAKFPLADLLSVVAYDEDKKYFVMDDNMAGFAFLCRPLPGSDGKEGDQLKSVMKQAWPAGTMINYSSFPSQNINDQVNSMLRMRMHSPDDIAHQAIKSRASYLFKGTLEPIDDYSGIKVREIHTIITVKFPIASPSSISLNRSSIPCFFAPNLGTNFSRGP